MPEQPDLAGIRAAIDELDERIVGLIAERQRRVEQAGRIKRGQDASAVAAPARVEAVIERVRRHARRVDASPEVVEAVYRAMIAEFIRLEHAVAGTDRPSS